MCKEHSNIDFLFVSTIERRTAFYGFDLNILVYAVQDKEKHDGKAEAATICRTLFVELLTAVFVPSFGEE